MKRNVTLRQAGGSLTATLPKEMADRLHLQPGDSLFAVETEHGILLTPYDEDFEQAMAVYARGARTYRNALRALSK
jgi:putative addiction module antidote